MDIVTIDVGGQIFRTSRKILNKSIYISEELGEKSELFIDRSPKIFRHVLELLRNSHYIYPCEYLKELKFYGIEYRKYGFYSDEMVILNVQGTEFRVQANILMAGSELF